MRYMLQKRNIYEKYHVYMSVKMDLNIVNPLPL